MHKNAMVASSKTQATAMISWLRLDPKEWEPVVYGQPVAKLYSHAKLVRPSAGVDQAHADWVFGKLVPSLTLSATTIPPNWRVPQDYVS